MITKCLSKTEDPKVLKIKHFKGQKYEVICKKLESKSTLFEDKLFKLEFPSEDIIWRRPTEDKEFPLLIDPKDDENVIMVQGNAAPDWFPVLLLAVRQKQYLEHILSYFDPKFQYCDPSSKYLGIFQFKFFINGLWQNVVIDDRLPYCGTKKMFTRSSNQIEFWEGLLEKSIAKVLGSYEELKKSDMIDVALMIAGSSCLSIEMDFSNEDIDRYDNFENNLRDALSRSSLIICQTKENKADALIKLGLNIHNFYLLNDLLMAPKILPRTSLPELASRLSISSMYKTVDLLQMRDALAKDNYTGPFHRNADIWKKMDPSSMRQQNLKFNFDNQFFIPFDIFIDLFQNIHIFYSDVLASYDKSMFQRKWKHPSPTRIQDLNDILKLSDQYLVEVKSIAGCNLKIALTKINSDRNDVSINSMDLEFGLKIFKVERNRRFKCHNSTLIKEITKGINITKSVVHYCITVILTQGSYIAVPYILNLRETKDYCFRIFADKTLEVKLLEQMPKRSLIFETLHLNEFRLITKLKVYGISAKYRVDRLFIQVKCELLDLRTINIDEPPYKWSETFLLYRKKPEKNDIRISLMSEQGDNEPDKRYGFADFAFIDWGKRDHGVNSVILYNELENVVIETKYKLKIEMENFRSPDYNLL